MSLDVSLECPTANYEEITEYRKTNDIEWIKIDNDNLPPQGGFCILKKLYLSLPKR